ncbi:MAG TPA: alpha/beta hydrolase [Solimonas sp.]|nr:alpha/beta hydrolase [Solimonas sp.]
MTVHASRSEFLTVRGLRYHLRRWGRPEQPLLVLGHGLLDASATFQDLVQPLLPLCQVLMPDWRGLGYSQWPQDGYWFPDYVADLAAILDHVSPERPVWLAGHSMGAQIASLYAGLKPTRVSRLILLDGLFLPDMPADLAPKRLRRWLDQLDGLDAEKIYPSFEVLAERVRRRHPQLSPERALFVARGWGAQDGHGRVRLLADPKHTLSGPGLYRAAESMAVWREVTAPTLFLDGGASPFLQALPAAELAQRRACFRSRTEAQIAGAGHMLHFDAPEATGRAMADFLAADA